MADALARTEAELRAVVKSDEPFLTEVARHLIDAGGKRVRPALTVTAAQVLDSEPGTATTDVVRGGVTSSWYRDPWWTNSTGCAERKRPLGKPRGHPGR